MKATYGEIAQHSSKCIKADCNCEGAYCEKAIEAREIFKDPITDDGTKKSKKGLLQVYNSKYAISLDRAIKHFYGEYVSTLYVKDQCTWEQEKNGMLQTVFKDGKLVKETSLDEIRSKLNKQLNNK